MSRTSANPCLMKAQLELLERLDRPSIRVLIYTDDPDKMKENGIFGIHELRRHLAAHPPAFAEIDLRPLLSRNSSASKHADNRLDDELNNTSRGPYHEIWFFGLHQANKPRYKLDFPGGGGPHSELEPEEVAALDTWMTVDPNNGSKGIGVLMAGDHANPRPDEQPISGSNRFCPPGMDHQRFFGLGRAIGKNVPRAGLLRKWEGPPTHCAEDSFNTLFPPPSEIDVRAQQLNLPRFDQHGNPNPSGEPHAVFRGKNGEWIAVLPDHEHEGAVVLPESFPESIWPRGPHIQPLPRYIAFGTDRRTGDRLNILAAYNGDAAGRGRIIADSSWHHYFNVNLQNLSASHLDVPAADQIGQFYSNLVVWLAPPEIRKHMMKAMFIWLATHPLMVEEVGAGPLNIGTVALRLLRQVTSDCEIHELLVAACPESLRQTYETFTFPYEPELSELPTVEVLLGSIIGKYFEVSFQQDESSAINDKQLATIIHQGFTDAFLINSLAAATFAYQGLAKLFSFAEASVSPEAIKTFQCLQTLESVKQVHKRRNDMNALPASYFLQIDVDGDGTERFTLDLDQDLSDCRTVDPLGLVCPLSGWLRSGVGEAFKVEGTLVGRRFITLEIEFRGDVKLMMSGVVLPNDDFILRFVTLPKDAAISRTAPINPQEGDTGTGTGTQTFLAQGKAKK